MKFREKIKEYLPMLSTVFVIVCVVISLHGYVAPVYAVQEPEKSLASDNDKAAEKETEIAETTETTEIEAAAGTFDLEDGIYEGSGTGFAGTVKVSVEIKNHTITAINILSTQDDEAFFTRARGVIDKIIAAQNVDVDVVSGATYSSKGIIHAVKNALTGEVDNSGTVSQGASAGAGSTSVSKVEETGNWKDGTYYGSGTGFAGTITVQVVVENGKISTIVVTDHSDGGTYMNSASAVISRMISAQSTNVDTVSGATYSSAGIIHAVRDALSEASVSGCGDDSSNGDDGNHKTDISGPSDKEDDEPAVTGTIPYKNGIYFGIGEGYLGDVEVCIVIQEKTIKAIYVTGTSDDEAYFNRAKGIIATVMKKQTTDVDTISGATYSSNGILEAVEEALKAADEATNGGTIVGPALPDQPDETEVPDQPDETEVQVIPDETEPPQTIYIDGDYTVSVVCEPDEDEDFEAYQLSATITVKNDRIIAITNISGDGDSGNDSYINRAANGTSKIAGVAAQITAKGLPEEIDAVSRATCSSNAIVAACIQALENAER